MLTNSTVVSVVIVEATSGLGGAVTSALAHEVVDGLAGQ
jgi:Flp pilus assembly pilin Flp